MVIVDDINDREVTHSAVAQTMPCGDPSIPSVCQDCYASIRRQMRVGSAGPLSALRGFMSMGEAAKPVILVVDDEKLVRLHAACLLEDHGFSVIEAESADAALKMLESRDDVRLLFTDIHMPGANDGMELARQVHVRWPKILLVITSCRTIPTRAEIPVGRHFMLKPHKAHELLSEVMFDREQ